ncbi:helix-turn-helix transcriptional regulator [Pseudomonas paeninsulae]|uniref:helix-turn-helix transcriptional regulator n=1 Tax=Pseudomonas paeninsulae TaxID=3110772 RepID=UPI002D7A17BE|nr:AlpA family phage regulatory protein [Pseudomonas sp. IT1137]
MNNIQPLKAASCAASLPQFDPAVTIIRMPELEAITGLARPTVYKRLKEDPTFPRAVPLSDSKSRGAPVGWVLGEVQAWVASRIAKRDHAVAA